MQAIATTSGAAVRMLPPMLVFVRVFCVAYEVRYDAVKKSTAVGRAATFARAVEEVVALLAETG